ncbi:hypothetical protein A2778_00730 [Candidatus Daviesbacteria bacterium RIFCSPHIGHO2_01_FULL_40_24]|nr:MAG: hypothetical protein A2778_00730 [Candidatus Daviesbacteria bacterium RIFCSPHIGHO2_01_FULL_40_24]OGE28443.1 MAG: hypothetical protein A3C29_05725 [Candidatus Daviesbacteria bacterium RIFCSPHIGHO2_02_FULL_40_16]OGE42074.1 MAG: hypothetical protein A3A53_04230 [Candidatus Daviesbacteria bacterium RIFCSPLOWO2_01_FULL_39_23]OGE66198.1 MAG: hypothetical protein A3J16_04515 [Candidatus Daviesbacteria bacterium RIFCSPLOWO2_02_FULL_39_13]HCE31194.1 hypothetical protein [Candidatus Daviesbacteri
MKYFILKLFVLFFVFLLGNIMIGTDSVRKFDCDMFFPDLEYERYCLPLKSFGFNAWVVFLSIPVLTFLSGFLYKSVKIFLLVDIIWILLTESLVRIFEIPAIYSSLEHSYLEYSIFAAQVPVVIYPKGIIISDQMKVLAILVILSLGSGYLGSLLKTIISRILSSKLVRFHSL